MRLCFEGNKSIGVRAHSDSRGGVGAALFSLQLEVLPFPFSPELPDRTLRWAALGCSAQKGKARLGCDYCRREAEAAEPSADNGAWREGWGVGGGERRFAARAGSREWWERGRERWVRGGSWPFRGWSGVDGVGGRLMAWMRWAMLTEKSTAQSVVGGEDVKRPT